MQKELNRKLSNKETFDKIIGDANDIEIKFSEEAPEWFFFFKEDSLLFEWNSKDYLLIVDFKLVYSPIWDALARNPNLPLDYFDFRKILNEFLLQKIQELVFKNNFKIKAEKVIDSRYFCHSKIVKVSALR